MLTKEQINALEPGLPADTAVAEFVMGWKKEIHREYDTQDDDYVEYVMWVGHSCILHSPPSYSTDHAAAMELVELMEKDGGSVHTTSYDGRHRECTVYSDHWAGRVHAEAPTLQLAIVKVGLLWALELKELKEREQA